MDLSLDKRMLKIFRDLNDNVAPTDSPHFTGIPRVPSPNGENVKQISNTEYATMKINALYDLILASVTINAFLILFIIVLSTFLIYN